MLIEFILALLLGLITGTITGLIPGIHTNLLAASLLILISSQSFPQIPTQIIIIFISATAISHTFLNFIPSIYFGAPDEDTALSTLPGHEFLKKGLGHYALILTLIGSTIAILSLIILIPLFILIIPLIRSFVERMMAFFLIWVSFFLIYSEKHSKISSIIIFFLAGFLGIASLNLNINQPIFPLLSGLFGSSTLIYSIHSKTKIPPQSLETISLPKKEYFKPTLATILVSPICSFFPGIGSSQAAIIGSKISGKLNREQFLILLGSINTLVMAISFVTLFLIGKSRTGAANAISQITIIDSHTLILILTSIIVTAAFSIPIAILSSRLISKHIHKVPYSKISIFILLLLTTLVILFSSFLGLLVFITSTFLGLTCIFLKTKRSFLMGSLLVPTILFYLPF